MCSVLEWGRQVFVLYNACNGGQHYLVYKIHRKLMEDISPTIFYYWILHGACMMAKPIHRVERQMGTLYWPAKSGLRYHKLDDETR